MYRSVLMAVLLLCSSPVVYAQQELSAESQDALKQFLAMENKDKHSVITEMVLMKKYDEARYLIAEWEKNAAEGQGPSDFLKNFVDNAEQSEKKE